MPRGAELAARLSSVLEVVYLIFNEGYSATAGDDWMRPQLSRGGAPPRPHPGGARAGRAGGARPRRADGDPGVALRGADRPVGRADPAPRPEPRALGPAPDPPRACALRGRERAKDLGRALGPYALQAAIAACHARARTPEETDWPRIVALYEELAEVVPSPVVELNRAVAVSMAYGPAGGPCARRRAHAEPTLKAYHLLPSVRGDLLKKLGRLDEARAEFERAASLTGTRASESCCWSAPPPRSA